MVDKADKVRERLIELGGRTSQEFGLGRIFGQVLAYLYLNDDDISLDKISEDLGLSKASVSIVARQLESLGLIRRTWKKGDRKIYFRTAANIAEALKQGVYGFVMQRLQSISAELDIAYDTISVGLSSDKSNEELLFLEKRVKRAKELKNKVLSLIDNPLLKMVVK